MQVRFDTSDPLSRPAPLLVVPVPQGSGAGAVGEGFLKRLDDALSGAVSRVLSSGDLTGAVGEDLVLYGPEGGPARVALVGIGDRSAYDAEQVRRFTARGVRVAERLHLDSVSCWLEGFDNVGEAVLGQAGAEGAALAAWRFTELKQTPEDAPQTRVKDAAFHASGDAGAVEAGVARGRIVAAAENFARTLQSRPGNIATPSHLASEAERMAAENGLDVTIFDEERMEAEGMGAILAVSQGSEEEARLIVLEHHGGAQGEAPLILVGKGVTFDAGGISIKPAAAMDEMKFDMSGGAAVIAALQAMAQLGVKANVVGIVPSSENLPSGTAVKPGDVIHTLAGKTVEVMNTDAEGRLLLADALAWGARMKPAAMVDCATLTGAVIVGLGHHASGVLGNDDGLVEEVRAAGERSGERCWPLPLWKEYREQLDSETADIMNIGGRPAGTITAAAFLKEFVGDTKWAHLDVAGTAWGDGKLPYRRKGGTGVPTRLLVEWVLSRVG